MSKRKKSKPSIDSKADNKDKLDDDKKIVPVIEDNESITEEPFENSKPVTPSDTTVKAKKTSSSTIPWYKQPRYVVVLSIVAILAVVLAGLVVWQQNKQATEQVTTVQGKKNKKKTDVPKVSARRLDGVVVATADANKVPACVMIENAAFDGVRPQAGLSAASVVYEIIVEGGITRLMAVYGGESAEKVGPVRSARDTYIEFVSEYNCAYVHAGGSYTAMQAIPRFDLRNVDALIDGTWFWRDSAKYSPHNLFTSTDNLYEAIKDGHSWTDEPVYAPWNFVDDSAITTGETANEVTIDYGGSYNVKYQYNAEQKYYERWNGNILQTDANNGATLTTRNVVIETVPPGEFIEGKGRVNFSVTGEGDVYIFRNGLMTKGKWKKADRLDRTRYYDESGNEIPLARGTTWVQVVPEGYAFAWQ